MSNTWFYQLCHKLDDVSKRHGTKNCAESLEAYTQELRAGEQEPVPYELDSRAEDLFVGVMELAPNKFQALYCTSCAFAVVPNDFVSVVRSLSCGGISCWMRGQKMDNSISCPWYTRRSDCITDVDFDIMRRHEKKYYEKRLKKGKKNN